MSDLNQKLDRYTKTSSQSRGKAFRWLARQNQALILEAFEKQKEYYFSLSKIDEPNKSILYLSALYLAAVELHQILIEQKRKNKVLDIQGVHDPTALQVKQFRQRASGEKWNRLVNLKGKIVLLVEQEGLSFREISRFLSTYHRLNVSHSYIATFYHALKEKNG